jgi:hypothetical protein
MIRFKLFPHPLEQCALIISDLAKDWKCTLKILVDFGNHLRTQLMRKVLQKLIKILV